MSCRDSFPKEMAAAKDGMLPKDKFLDFLRKAGLLDRVQGLGF